jgi:hypothetical protein
MKKDVNPDSASTSVAFPSRSDFRAVSFEHFGFLFCNHLRSSIREINWFDIGIAETYSISFEVRTVGNHWSK